MLFSKDNIKNIPKQILLGILLGVLGGLLGTLFHISVDYVTDLRQNNAILILFLPLGGLAIAAMYSAFKSKGNIDTRRVFQSVKEEKDVPIVMLPLIFVGTVITHAFGGSAGREGAALQLGGSMGYNVGKALRQDKQTVKLLVTAGMSGVFSALFGTPLTAAVFSLEVTGLYNLCGLLTGVISSTLAYLVSQFLGVEAVRFDIPRAFSYQVETLLKVVLLSLLCAGVCIVFSIAMGKTKALMVKYIQNQYIRAVVGGLIIVLLTIILKTTDYNGAGMDVIERAISGDVIRSAFLMKIIFTAITIAAGFKGGEIVPTFFIGATFGSLAGSLLGLNAGLGASLGFIALFSGMTKCPIASLLLAIEVFGAKAVPLFIISVVIAYVFSGRFGLYGNAKLWCRKNKA